MWFDWILALKFAAFALVLRWLLGLRYIPHNRLGIVEKLWSNSGSLTGGRIVASSGEAGFQATLLRGGVQPWLFPFQYRVHLEPLVVISEGRLGYVYARDGAPLPPTQTLGRVVACNHFQDAEAFLRGGGQRGRQRAVLREGVYAINLALFVVITDERVYTGPIKEAEEKKFADWQRQLAEQGGFSPVVIGQGSRRRAENVPDAAELTPFDTIGAVTVHDGAPIESGEIIAPEVKATNGGGHAYFQDPEAFLAQGGRRGKQLQVLTDGTFFINRWFATVEVLPKTLIPIGYVGVVISYHGSAGRDTTGEAFRYGEQVESGQRGVWKRALPPGKYPLNPYALRVELVPTVNFVLRWVTGLTEMHQYDRDLTSIDLITADGYEPVLPLSLVLHIDYEKAPSVVQRFGDVRRLISQTLDPILAAYFRDVAQSCNMLDLLTQREEIQARATAELGRRFTEYDINCVAVLIGRPESKLALPGAEDPIERLFDQLRVRRLADEQKETYAKQEEAAAQLRALRDAEAAAQKQTQLTEAKVDVEIAGHRGAAQLAEAQRLAERDIVLAGGRSRAAELTGKGEAARVAQVGLSEAAVFLNKIRAYGDPRLFALSNVSEQFAHSAQPLVPERLFVTTGGGGEAGEGGAALSGHLLNQLLTLLLADRAGLGASAAPADLGTLEQYAADLVKDVPPAPDVVAGKPQAT